MTRIERFALGIAAVLAITTTAATFAQASSSAPSITWVTLEAQQDGPQGPPPPGDFPGGRPPRDGRPGGPPRMPPPIAAATIPVEEMTTFLKLTGAQVSKIKEINAALREEMRPPRRPEQGDPQGPPDGGQRPQPPSREEREARNKAMDAAIQKASASIIAILDDEQKPKLATMLKAFEALRAGRIPPFALRDVKLTASQWSQIAALGKNATREQIEDLLTDAQKSALESSRPGPGERGSRGPGDGPPPPPFGNGNGPGGPPPGDF